MHYIFLYYKNYHILKDFVSCIIYYLKTNNYTKLLMTTLSPEFKKNIESAILKHGRFACPNIACTDWITSKKIIKNDGSEFLEYQCKSSKCTFHSKTIIPIEAEDSVLEIVHSNFSKKYKRLLVGFASVLLILTIAFGGYFPKLFVDDASTNISKKENIKPVVKKRTIVLSTPVFKEKK